MKMALSKAQVKDLPSGAIVLTEEQAIKYQMKLVNSWKNPWDVICFKYGSFSLGISTFLTGLYLNNYFRRQLKLGHYGRISTVLTVSLLPSIFSVVFHQQAVLPDVLLISNETCPICLETRASSIQTFLGGIIPIALAPFANFSLASVYYTYPVPNVGEEPRKLWELIKQKYRPLKGKVFGLLAFQMVLASLVTYLEVDSIFRVHRKLSILEEAENEA